MKIIDRPAFLELDRPVVYAKYEPCHTYEFGIAHGRCGTNDFVCVPLALELCVDAPGPSEVHAMLTDADDNGTEVPMRFDCTGRDGMYESDDQQFAVLSDDDTVAMITAMAETLPPDHPVRKALIKD